MKAIVKLRDDIYAVDLTGGQAFAYGRRYINVETDKVSSIALSLVNFIPRDTSHGLPTYEEGVHVIIYNMPMVETEHA